MRQQHRQVARKWAGAERRACCLRWTRAVMAASAWPAVGQIAMNRMLTIAAVSAAFTLTAYISLPSRVFPVPVGFHTLASLQSDRQPHENTRDRDPLRGWDRDQRWDSRG